MATCAHCRRDGLILSTLADRAIPLDPDRLEPAPGLTAYNPATRGARVLTARTAGTDPAWRWAYAGVTFHEQHARTCPAGTRPIDDRRPGQHALFAAATDASRAER